MSASLARAHQVQVAAVGVARPLPFAATLFLNASRNTMERERREKVMGAGLNALREQLPDQPELWGVYAVAGRWSPTVMRYARAFGSDLIVSPALTREAGRVEHGAARRLLASAWQPVFSIPDGTVARLPARAMVGVDLGPAWEVPVREAVAVMSQDECALVLVHVLPHESAEWSAEWREEYVEAASRHLESRLGELDLPPHVRVESRIVNGQPAMRLRELAAELECDMLVVGRAGEDASGEAGTLTGEVADLLLHDCAVPLLVVPAQAEPKLPERTGVLELGVGAVPEMARILVPLDGSLVSEQAVSCAADIARRTGADLRLVHVEGETLHESLPVSYPKDLLNQSLLTGVSVEARVLSGVPADAVLGEAGAFDASLLVLTSRGRGGVNRAVLGSVADRVIRRSEVPVLLVRPATPADDDDRSTGKPTAESLRGSGNFNRVLIPLDGSESAERVIPHVLAVAGTEDVHYVLMRAHPAPVNTALPSSVPIIGRELAPMEDGYLGSVAARMSEFGALVSVRSDRASGMTVPQAIVRRAQEDDVDLIAMTTRGLGGIDRMLFGSVAEHVLRHAPCSVLVLRPTEDDQPGIHAGANVLPVPR